MNIVGTTGLVTGAATGIGETIAEHLGAHGLVVIAADVDVDGARETVLGIESDGGSGMAIEMDLENPTQISEAIETIQTEGATIDVLINNAGIAGPTATVENVTLEEWERTLAVNLRGPYLLCNRVLPPMKEQEYGRIVNISSASGKRPVPQRAPYTASKSGLLGLTRTIAAEGGSWNVNANAVCPGSVAGPRIQRVIEHQSVATGRSYEELESERLAQGLRSEFVTADDVAHLVSFLCSTGADRITGQAINVSAGKVVD